MTGNTIILEGQHKYIDTKLQKINFMTVLTLENNAMLYTVSKRWFISTNVTKIMEVWDEHLEPGGEIVDIIDDYVVEYMGG